jgi:monofunctional glycosyltransferase
VWLGRFLLGFYVLIILVLVGLRWLDPPTTSVQIERRMEAWSLRTPYHKRYRFIPLPQISSPFQHAVIAAEDARFYQHHGFDWRQVEIAATADLEKGKLRGASTIDQQVVKNLFFTTSRSFVRKILEASVVPFAEWILGKRRILELYMNIVEWGPGVYGADAAARYHYGIPASKIDRDQGARLAALLPAPRKRRPAAMTEYRSRILTRMRQMGW